MARRVPFELASAEFLYVCLGVLEIYVAATFAHNMILGSTIGPDRRARIAAAVAVGMVGVVRDTEAVVGAKDVDVDVGVAGDMLSMSVVYASRQVLGRHRVR